MRGLVSSMPAVRDSEFWLYFTDGSAGDTRRKRGDSRYLSVVRFRREGAIYPQIIPKTVSRETMLG